MEAWLDELRPYAGEPKGSAGWRLAKASWRLVGGQRTILQLVLVLAAVAAAQVYFVSSSHLHWRGGDIAWILLLDAAEMFVATYLLAAIVASADATLDGVSLDLAAALDEARERLRPLLGWAALFFVGWIGFFQIGRGLHSPLAGFLGLLAWYLVTFFAIPLVVLGGMGPRLALRESLGLLRGRKRQVFIALLGTFFFLGLIAEVPGTILLTHAAALHQETGEIPHLLFALGLFVTFAGFGLAVAAKEVFAVMVVRDEIDDLSPREYAGRRRSRGVRFLRFCGALVLLVAVFAAMMAINKNDRAVVKEANSPGSNYTTEVAYDGELPSGSEVLYRGRKIGEVLGSERDGSGLRVRFHVEPGFSPTSTPGELRVEAPLGTACLVLIATGETSAGAPAFY
ncbi:MAG TPA: hypothetical protein VFJ61_03540 [Solirubrobacterales bacterium]|nr:hypothetical protein [Solirubrobacterales bacterium]